MCKKLSYSKLTKAFTIASPIMYVLSMIFLIRIITVHFGFFERLYLYIILPLYVMLLIMAAIVSLKKDK